MRISNFVIKKLKNMKITIPTLHLTTRVNIVHVYVQNNKYNTSTKYLVIPLAI